MVAKFRKTKKSSSRKKIFFSVLLGVLLVLIISFLIVTNLKINQKRTKLISRIESLKKEIQILGERNREMKEGISQAGSKEHLERAARDELGLKSPGEEVVVVKEEKKEEEESQQEQERKSWWERIKSFLGR